VLGSAGARGGIGWGAALPPLTQPITLAGQGGLLQGWQTMTVSNVFSGTGELVYAPYSWEYIDSPAASTYSGGRESGIS